jgi:hypothetical protein
MEQLRVRWWFPLALLLLGLTALATLPLSPLPNASRLTTSRKAQRQAPASPFQPKRSGEPLLRAAAAPGTSVVVLFEVSALRHSLAGQLLLDCLASLDEADDGPSLALGELREQGLDLLQDLDRVAFVDGTVMASGDFSRVNWDTLLSFTTRETYGTDGQLRSSHTGAVGAEVPVFATWGTKLALLAPTRGAARAALDRVEGRSRTEALLSESEAYGDVYGMLRGTALRFLFGPSSPPLSAHLQAAARSVEFHLDATGDLLLVATVRGDDPGRLRALAQALTDALAQQVSEAAGSRTAEFLERAQVTVRANEVDLEVTIPLDVLRKQLGACGHGP